MLVSRVASQISSTLNDCDEIMETVYAKKVAEYLWYQEAYYQLGNKLNHIIDLMSSEYDAAHIEALGRRVIDGDPELHYKIVNVFADLLGWAEALKN